MRRLSLVSGACCLLFGLAVAVRADNDPVCRDIVVKAIKAHGGMDNLKKFKAVQAKFTGTIDSMGGIKFSGEFFTQDPDKLKSVIEIQVNNMNITVTQVYNGKEFWTTIMDKTIEFKDAKDLAEQKENMHLEKLSGLVDLLGKSIELSPLGEVKVENEDAVGVRASSKGHRDLNLFFSKKSGTLLKTEARVFDLEKKQEVSQEKIMKDYKESDGIMTPRRILINQDGKRHVTLEITEATHLERHDDSVFAKQ